MRPHFPKAVKFSILPRSPTALWLSARTHRKMVVFPQSGLDARGPTLFRVRKGRPVYGAGARKPSWPEQAGLHPHRGRSCSAKQAVVGRTSRPSEGRPCVLLVDDDADVAHTISSILCQERYEVVVAGSAAEALAAVADRAFDVRTH